MTKIVDEKYGKFVDLSTWAKDVPSYSDLL